MVSPPAVLQNLHKISSEEGQFRKELAHIRESPEVTEFPDEISVIARETLEIQSRARELLRAVETSLRDRRSTNDQERETSCLRMKIRVRNIRAELRQDIAKVRAQQESTTSTSQPVADIPIAANVPGTQERSSSNPKPSTTNVSRAQEQRSRNSETSTVNVSQAQRHSSQPPQTSPANVQNSQRQPNGKADLVAELKKSRSRNAALKKELEKANSAMSDLAADRDAWKAKHNQILVQSKFDETEIKELRDAVKRNKDCAV